MLDPESCFFIKKVALFCQKVAQKLLQKSRKLLFFVILSKEKNIIIANQSKIC